MSYIAEIFDRTDIKDYRSFLMCGIENNTNNNLNYKEILDFQTKKQWTKLIKCYLKMKAEMNNLKKVLVLLWGVYEDVFMEIGIKLGARFMIKGKKILVILIKI